MPHDLLHAHPFYDDRPLVDGARLSLSALTPCSEINPCKRISKANFPVFDSEGGKPFSNNRVI